MAHATCDSLAEGVISLFYILLRVWHRCHMGLMLMAASASNEMETENEFLTHDS
jgi:hypothetical protein